MPRIISVFYLFTIYPANFSYRRSSISLQSPEKLTNEEITEVSYISDTSPVGCHWSNTMHQPLQSSRSQYSVMEGRNIVCDCFCSLSFAKPYLLQDSSLRTNGNMFTCMEVNLKAAVDVIRSEMRIEMYLWTLLI